MAHLTARGSAVPMFRCAFMGFERWLLCLGEEAAYGHDDIQQWKEMRVGGCVMVLIGVENLPKFGVELGLMDEAKKRTRDF